MTYSHKEMTAGHDTPSSRQIEHWTQLGLLRVEGGVHIGSGKQRRWADGELAVVRMMVRLIQAGMELRLAHAVVRSGDVAVGCPVGGTHYEVSPGVWILVDAEWRQG